MKTFKQSPRPISGGATVTTYLPSLDKRVFFAHVEMNGERYPKEGVAINRSQTEAIYVILGEFSVTYNNESVILKKDDILYLEEGNPYVIQGSGEIVVAITPAEGGTTEIKV